VVVEVGVAVAPTTSVVGVAVALAAGVAVAVAGSVAGVDSPSAAARVESRPAK
jgi:hypothetical protein